MFAQRIWPQPGGQVRQAPGSATTEDIGAGQPASSPSGSAAACRWRTAWHRRHHPRVEGGNVQLLRRGGGDRTVDDITLTAAPGGRLWLAWRDVSDSKMYAARTNTRHHPDRGDPQVAAPGGTGSSGPSPPTARTVRWTWSRTSTLAGSPRLFATQILPGLSAKARPKKLNKGKVTITVTDAGDPVSGAKVKFRGKTVTTNGAGKAVFRVGKSVKAKTYKATASKTGYGNATRQGEGHLSPAPAHPGRRRPGARRCQPGEHGRGVPLPRVAGVRPGRPPARAPTRPSAARSASCSSWSRRQSALRCRRSGNLGSAAPPSARSRPAPRAWPWPRPRWRRGCRRAARATRPRRRTA